MALAPSLLSLKSAEPTAASPVNPAARLQTIWTLYQAGMTMMRANLKRAYPLESERETEARIDAWLSERSQLIEPGLRVKPRP